MHILGREVSVEVDRLSVPSLPECRPGPSFDSSGLHMTDTLSIPGMHSRETLCVRQGADNPKSALPNLPLVVVWTDPELDRWLRYFSSPRNCCLIRRAESISCLLCFPVSSREFRPNHRHNWAVEV